MDGVDYVVHAAALKQVDTAEYNPFEFVQTNVLGAQNVIDAAIDAGVQQGRRAVHRQGVQPDQPLRRHQARRRQAVRLRQPLRRRPRRPGSRWCATATCWAAAARSSRSSAGSRAEGAVAADHRQADDPLLDHAGRRRCDFVVDSFDLMQGGELYVPRIPSHADHRPGRGDRPGAPSTRSGCGPGEKLHEEMISPDEAAGRCDLDDRYCAPARPSPTLGLHAAGRRRPVADGFAYRSDTQRPVAHRGQLARDHRAGLRVVMLPYGRQSIDDDDVEAVVAALRGDWLTTGPAVDGSRPTSRADRRAPRVVAFNSGTAALHAAYAAAGIGPGDEVVTTPLTFVATRRPRVALGRGSVFADVDPRHREPRPRRGRRRAHPPHPRDHRRRLRRPSRRLRRPAKRRRRVGAADLDDAAHSHRRAATAGARSATSPT